MGKIHRIAESVIITNSPATNSLFGFFLSRTPALAMERLLCSLGKQLML